MIAPERVIFPSWHAYDRPTIRSSSRHGIFMRSVRITCLPINAQSEKPITVEAVLDDEDRIHGQHSLFGIWGRPGKDEEYYPFAYHGDGVVDYGSALEAKDRYFDFDLRSGTITINRMLSYKSKDRSIIVGYLIDDVTNLLVAK
jgi:hypothetical protein